MNAYIWYNLIAYCISSVENSICNTFGIMKHGIANGRKFAKLTAVFKDPSEFDVIGSIGSIYNGQIIGIGYIGNRQLRLIVVVGEARSEYLTKLGHMYTPVEKWYVYNDNIISVVWK